MKLNENQMSCLENALYEYLSNDGQRNISPIEVTSIYRLDHGPDTVELQSNVMYRVFFGYDGPKNENCTGDLHFCAHVGENILEDLLLGWYDELYWPTKPEYLKGAQFGWEFVRKLNKTPR